MMPRSAFLVLAGAAALAACSDNAGEQEATDLDKVASDGEAEAAREALVAGDFAKLELGARIGGESKDALANPEGNFADIRSYVACPAGMKPCDPETAPPGTIFTYVHVVFPGEDNDASSGDGEGNTASDIERATEFRLTMPANGFTGDAGYSKAEAYAAVGPKADVVITCHDGGLAWTISAGDGGDQWEQAEPLTFYWRSTLPPSGTAEAYEIFANYTAAQGKGPYPAAKDGAVNACAAPSTEG